MFHLITDASRSNTFTPFSMRGESRWSPRAVAGAEHQQGEAGQRNKLRAPDAHFAAVLARVHSSHVHMLGVGTTVSGVLHYSFRLASATIRAGGFFLRCILFRTRSNGHETVLHLLRDEPDVDWIGNRESNRYAKGHHEPE